MPSTPVMLGELVLADDDEAFLDLLVKTFRRDFVVHAAPDGRRALEILETVSPSAILVDEMMPHVLGTQVLALAKQRHPNAARMLMTASTDFERAVLAINQGEIHRFFAKPLRPLELRQAVISVVERVRGDALLRVELDTLRDVKKQDSTQARALLFSADPSVSDVVVAACKVRGYAVTLEHSLPVAQTLVTNKALDLLIAVRDPDVDMRPLIQLARTVDESVAVVVVDANPTTVSAEEALAAGANDFLGAPLGTPEGVAQRLERALHQRLALVDMHRVTRELLNANRSLALARRNQDQQQVKVLNAMVRALEARDSYTAGHTDRVAAISVRLAETLALAPDRVEHVRIGALLHDIGKIGVRDSVLLKPGSLTADEYDAIKQHPALGHELLMGVDQFECVVPIIRMHHERLDGSGYPDRLVGDQITLEARIVAVADILDAITSTRPYRAGTSLESAFEILARLEGKSVDQGVCQALRVLHQRGRLQDLLQNMPS